MTRIAFLLTLMVTALAGVPAHAQRVFVSGTGLDTNPCTVAQPCRTFQQAYNTVAANGEIDVIDPAGYGSLVITHGISIQGHGFSGITQAVSTGAAITISVTTSDPITLNGLLLDGAGTGQYGILITSGPSVQILNSVIRHFQVGIWDHTSTSGSNLLIEDTIASDNATTGILVTPSDAATKATLNRITANNNQFGVGTDAGSDVTITNSVLSNNSGSGLDSGAGATWLAKTVISGNATGVLVAGGTVKSYGDNYINDNPTPVSGTLTPVSMQ
jgi:Right handed beta helix region